MIQEQRETGMHRKLGLKHNPFEPSGTGAPISESNLVFTDEIETRLHELLDRHQSGHGARIIVLVGEYGAGKTCILKWLHRVLLPKRRIRSFYLDEPTVQFYSLADTLLRSIGRMSFAKLAWELAAPHISDPCRRNLFQKGFEEYLSSQSNTEIRQEAFASLKETIVKIGVTEDEEIAHCLTRIVTEAARQPYVTYKDFVTGQRDPTAVSEGEEAPYLGAFVNMIIQGSCAEGVALSIDGFEEIGLSKKLTKRTASAYQATLRRLTNLSKSRESKLWTILSLTPDEYEMTRTLDPELEEHLCGEDHVIQISPPPPETALELMRSRLTSARSNADDRAGSLFPFRDDLRLRPSTLENPRRLVKLCSHAISGAHDDTVIPFTDDYLHQVDLELHPPYPSS